jgi:hypothetical protein
VARPPRLPLTPPDVARARRQALHRTEGPGPHSTVGELETKIGVPLRTLIYWSDRLVLRATAASQAGRGTHRRFDLHEQWIAALLKPLASASLPITVLGSFATIFRDNLRRNTDLGKAIGRAATGIGQNWTVMAYTPPDRLDIGLATADAGEPLTLPLQHLFEPALDSSEALILLLDLNRQLAGLEVG